MQTLVIQSCPAQECVGWLQSCMDSVQLWCQHHGFEYRWLGDELFDFLPAELHGLAQQRPVIASDLARLLWMQDELRSGRRLVWLDADVLIFQPEQLTLPVENFAVGRELWVQPAQTGGWKVWKKVHNAALMASPGQTGASSFVDFYIDSALRLLSCNPQTIPDQFIGPKLLSALHNVVQFPVWESVAMFSPAVMQDLLQADNAALLAMQERASQPVRGANLCRSSVLGGQLEACDMARVIEKLQQEPPACLIAPTLDS